MMTMSGGPCLHYDCTNRNSFGYCKTTACINKHYRHEQWVSTSNRTEQTVFKPQTQADRIRAMSDEELAEMISDRIDCSECKHMYAGEGKPCHNGKCCPDYWLEWLREEVATDG